MHCSLPCFYTFRGRQGQPTATPPTNTWNTTLTRARCPAERRAFRDDLSRRYRRYVVNTVVSPVGDAGHAADAISNRVDGKIRPNLATPLC